MLRVFVIILALAASALAQTTTASLSGTVSDSSGGVVPGAKVVATNIDTANARATTSNAAGNYTLPLLPIGRYKIEVSFTGYKKYEQSPVTLEVGATLTLDPKLEVGAVSETIEVTAEANIVETTKPGLGSMVTNKEIDALPLVNRDIYTLLTLTAGVDTTDTAADNFGSPQQVTVVNGSPNSGIGSVNYSLDGGSNTNGLRNTGNSAPNPDAIQEFRVTTNSYPADEGRFAGGSVTMVTKSGTNQWHGTLFEFLRNNQINARRWLPGQSNLTVDALHRNQFGGTLGGPIVKNKTFIFGSYSGLRERTNIFANTATPFTAIERTGDLSRSPGTAPVDSLAANAPFPGRIIPASRFDPVAVKILSTYVPLPNLANGNFESQIPHPRDTDELIFKGDHNLSTNHRLTASLFYSKGSDLVGLLGNLPWVSRDFTWSQYNYNLSDTWIVAPNKINELRASYIRNFGGRTNYPGISLGDLGSKYQIQGPPSLPQIQVAGRFNLNSAIPGPVAGSNQYQIRDVFSYTSNRHNIRIGGELILEKMIHDTLLNNYGNFSFTTNNPRGTRNATADFLMGLPATMNQDAPTTKINNSWYSAMFIQDDWRPSNRLTVNLGLRWDIQTPPTDPFDRYLTYVPGAKSVVVPSAPAGLLFPGDKGVARGIIGIPWGNVSPRLGFAWDPKGDRKTAIRGAAGIFFGSMSGNQWNSSSDNQPFAIRQQFNDVYTLSDPYRLQPGGVAPFPYSYSPGTPKFIAPSAIVGIDLGYKSPYSYQMNFAIQRQVTQTVSVTAAYVSTLTHRIPAIPDQNYPVLTPTATTANVNARRPYLPGVLSTVGLTKSILNSAYHGFQLTADKRMSKRFTVRGFYTFGKSLDFINTQNSTQQQATDWNNIGLDRGRTNGDRRHNAVLSGLWDISYFNRSKNLPLRWIAGGWSAAMIASLRSGTPLTVTAGTDFNLDGNNNDRPDLIGDPKMNPNRTRDEVVNQWFNIAAFSRTNAAIRNFAGTAGRNILDGPGMKNFDMTLARNIRVTEKKSFQFRMEGTNFFNIVNLGNPGANANANTFGKVTNARPMRQLQLGLKFLF